MALEGFMNCVECGKRARWHVWFAGYELYGAACDEHARQFLAEGRNGWPVACVQLVPLDFLEPDDDARIRIEAMNARHQKAEAYANT